MKKKLSKKKLEKMVSIDFTHSGNAEAISYDAAVFRVSEMVEQGLFEASLAVLGTLELTNGSVVDG